MKTKIDFVCSGGRFGVGALVVAAILGGALTPSSAMGQANSRREALAQCPTESVGAFAVMTHQGMSQLVETIVRQSTELVESIATTAEFAPVELAPQPSSRAAQVCGPEAFARAELGAFWNDCWGIPAFFAGGVQGWRIKELARPVPTKFRATGLKVRDLEFGRIHSTCEGTTCTVKAAIKKLAVRLDLRAHSLLDDTRLAGFKRLKLVYKPQTESNVEIKVDATGDSGGRLSLRATSIKVDRIPPGSFKLEFDLSDAENTRLADQLITKAYEKLGAKVRLAPARDRNSRTRAMLAVKDTHAEAYAEAIEGALREVVMPQFFEDDLSAVLMSIFGQLLDPDNQQALDQLLGVFKMAESLVNRLAPGLLLPVINEEATTVPGIGSDLIIPTQLIRLQDHVDSDKIVSRANQSRELARRVEQADLSRATLESNDDVKNLRRHWHVLRVIMAESIDEGLRAVVQDQLQDAVRLSEHSRRAGWSAEVQSWLSNETADWTSFARSFDVRRRAVSIDVSLRPQRPRLLRDGRVGVQVSTCFNGQAVPAIPPFETMNPPNSGHDLTVGVTLAVLNDLIAREYQASQGRFLRVCLNDHPTQTCADQALLAPVNQVGFTNPPRLAMDERTGEVYLEASDLVRSGTVAGSSILGKLPFVGDKVWRGRIYLDLKANSSGDLDITVKRLDGSLTLNTLDLLGFLTSSLEAITFLFQNEIIKSIGSKLAPRTDFALTQFVDFDLKEVGARQGILYFQGRLVSIKVPVGSSR